MKDVLNEMRKQLGFTAKEYGIRTLNFSPTCKAPAMTYNFESIPNIKLPSITQVMVRLADIGWRFIGELPNLHLTERSAITYTFMRGDITMIACFRWDLNSLRNKTADAKLFQIIPQS